MQRLFFGLCPTESERKRLAAQTAELAALLDFDRLRWIPSENLHVTVVFLGQLAKNQVEAAREAGMEAATSVNQFSMRLSDVSLFPSPAKPRVLAILVDPDRVLNSLHATLSETLSERGLSLDRRPYKPHLTIARIRGRSSLKLELPPIAATDVNVSELILYQSISTDNGVRYKPLNCFPLNSAECTGA